MTGLSTVLMTPKIAATASSVPAFAASPCPETTIPGTAQAATPSAAADTMTPRRILMGLFLQYRGLCARRGCWCQSRRQARVPPHSAPVSGGLPDLRLRLDATYHDRERFL